MTFKLMNNLRLDYFQKQWRLYPNYPPQTRGRISLALDRGQNKNRPNNNSNNK